MAKRLIKQISAFVVACLLTGSSFAAVDDSAVRIKWSYKGAAGPAHWANLSPAFTRCATGKLQSPINIQLTPVNTTLETFKLSYQPSPLSIIDNGTTTVTVGSKKLIITSGHGVQLNVPAAWQKKQTLLIGKTSYHLLQLHFHSPSEHQLKNEAFAAEIHFLHQGAHGELAVIAVFIKMGNANPILEKIINNIPPTEGHEIKLPNKMDIRLLLPHAKSSYQFLGSLTTPPCIEGVKWLVMQEPVTASAEQIVKLRKAANGGNARPVQSLQNRSMLLMTERIK